MNKKTIVVIAIAIFAVGAVIGNFVVKQLRQPPEPSPATASLIGSPLPDFSLLGLDGVREHMNQWQGKVRIINFWATWCPPCKREIPALIDLQDQYKRHGLQVVGIALDKAEAVREYVKEANINYPILLGESDAIEIAQQLGNDMGILPYTVIADQAGNITYVKYGEVSRETVEAQIKPLL